MATTFSPFTRKVPQVDMVDTQAALASAEFDVGGAASGRPKTQTVTGGYGKAQEKALADAAVWGAIDAGSLDTYKPWRNWTEIAGQKINLDQTEEQIAADLARIFGGLGGYGAGGTGGAGYAGGGGTSGGSMVDIEAKANALRQYMASIPQTAVDYTALADEARKRFGGYRTTLDELIASATGRQESAAQVARENLAGLTPSSVMNVTPADIGMGSAAGYLSSIGASPADVEAVRAFEQQMLNQSLAGTRGYSQRVADVEDLNRLEQQRAIETILQEAASGLASTGAGYNLGLSDAERAVLEDYIMREQEQKRSIDQALLEARLAGADIGVVL